MRSKLVVSLLAAGAILLCHRGLPAQNPSPRIAVVEETWDLGSVPQNQEYKHKFRILNSGGGELEIRQVIPSCQCAAAMPEKNRLQAGEETTIEVSLRTLTFQGHIHKTVTVQSNDPARPSLQLHVKADVMPPYYVVPQSIELGSFSKVEDSREATFRIVVSPGSRVSIKSVASTSPLLSVVPDGPLEERPDGSRSQTYTVQFKKGAPVGLLRESIWIDTDLPTKPRTDIVAIATVEGEVAVSPATLNLGRVKPGDTVLTPFIVTKSGTADLIIQSVGTSQEGAFEAASREVENGRKYEVTLKISPDAKKGFQKGTLNIRTNVQGEGLLQAYFYAFVER